MKNRIVFLPLPPPLFIALIAMLWCCPAFAAPNTDYTTLKKYIAARMFSEAYLELMQCELRNKDEDPKLLKLRKDLLKPARAEAEQRFKVKPDDAGICLVLGDISFHEGKLDKATEYLTRALDKRDDALTHYTFAKILFVKGKISQSFDQIEKALQLDPASEILFDDFQFLYNAKNYGLSSAKRLTGKAGFMRRATPVAAELSAPHIPDNPFENDPTAPPDVHLPPEPEPEPDLMQTAQVPVIASQSSERFSDTKPASVTSPQPFVEIPDDFVPANVQNELPPKITIASVPEITSEDPERKKMKEAEYWLEQAKKKFADKSYNDAEDALKSAKAIFHGLPGYDELQAKIDEKKQIEQKYKFAISLYESEKYDLALPDILKAYEDDPEKYAEASFYLGKIYVLGSKPDYKKAKYYFDKFVSLPNVNPALKRDVEWIMIGVLMDAGEYKEAYERFNSFVEKEEDYAKNQKGFWTRKYRLWAKNYSVEIAIGLSLFIGAFIGVFLLHIIHPLNFLISDPVKKAKNAVSAGRNDKAVQIVENALRRADIPIQIQRQLLEIAVQAHYAMKNYYKCQESAKELLNLFSDNPIGRKYLAKAYLESKTINDEAVALYEAAYKEDPSHTEFLPLLSKYYRSQKEYTAESMDIMYAYFQLNPGDHENVTALADAYVQNNKIGDEAIAVLNAALKIHPDGPGYRELLARNYAKKGMFAECAKECSRILEKNVDDMGIHVVYTTAMKKMNMLDEAVLQYEELLRKHPGNPQLMEILTGLRKELEGTASASPESFSETEELSPFAAGFLSEKTANSPVSKTSSVNSEEDIDGFVEPPPEGFDVSESSPPLPDFLKTSEAVPSPHPAEEPEYDPLQDLFASIPSSPDSSEKPNMHSDEDLHLTNGRSSESSSALSPIDDILSMPTLDPFLEQGLDENPSSDELGVTPTHPEPVQPRPKNEPSASNTNDKALAEARQKASKGKWEEVVSVLTPVFASQRSKEVGLLLADAHLHLKKPELAKEIIDTIEFDRELISDELKDLLYRIATALESAGRTNEALELYDMICNVDINYRDAFDRSDRIYASLKKHT